MPELENEQVMDLESDFYILYQKDKHYIKKYYESLVNDIMYVLSDMEQFLEIANNCENEAIMESLDLMSVIKEKQNYAVKTIAHMVTLLDFAAAYSIAAEKESDENKKREMIYKITEGFIKKLGEDFEDALYECLVIDLEKLVEACHRSFADNIENTLLSVRQDYPDFLSEEFH